jgi:lipopolysaccharide/colanic/teichoic acid biosynthesis glycosyltransferase
MKRLFDFLCSLAGLVVLSPILILFLVAIWLQDFKSPFYIAPRVGRNFKLFNMVKIRSMIVNAEKSGVDSTSANDMRITAVGRMIRKFKIDELSQLWNVLIGDMSLVGPRPNVGREVALYTDEENHLLDVRPGITDPSSIVFSDEGVILVGSDDPDLMYNQVIRPWKSRLSLLYVQRGSLWIDLKLIFLTIIAVVSKQAALSNLQPVLRQLGANEELLAVARRESELLAHPPPGADQIVSSRCNLREHR